MLRTGPNATTLTYDPMMRLYQTASGATTARLAYDGLDRIAEYDGSNLLQRRYVHGPGADEPIVWYEGNGTTDRRFLVSDERGSIVSVTDGAGTLLGLNKYDEYGMPQSTNLGAFGYTGQAWLPTVGVWYYKARMYDAELGRFLQPDPIGMLGGTNWYAYVGNDPVNMTDPLGLQQARCESGGLDAQGGCTTIVVTGPSTSSGGGISGGGGAGSGGVIGIMSGDLLDRLKFLLADEEEEEHEYEVDVDVKCSADQAFDAYLAARSAPGAGRSEGGQTERNVQLFGGDWISQTIDYSNRTILNETVQGRHRFDPGTIFIRIRPINGGANISIIGRGTGDSELLNWTAFNAFFRAGAYSEKVRCAVMGNGGSRG